MRFAIRAPKLPNGAAMLAPVGVQRLHDVDDLDQRVDGRAGGVLVGVAHGVAGDGGLVRLGALVVGRRSRD